MLYLRGCTTAPEQHRAESLCILHGGHVHKGGLGSLAWKATDSAGYKLYITSPPGIVGFAFGNMGSTEGLDRITWDFIGIVLGCHPGPRVETLGCRIEGS